MLRKQKNTAWMLKASLSALLVLVTFLVVDYAACNAQGLSPKSSNQFTGSISQGFIHTPLGNTLGHFVIIPEEGDYAGKTLGVIIDKSTLVNGQPAASQSLDQFLVSGCKIEVGLQAAPETLPPTSSAEFGGTAATVESLVYNKKE